jgi:hypothetical protein
MPETFDIFGEINLESRAFQGSIKHVVGSLQAADKELDKTIAKSNKLGDTSATVARRYEKLAEGIKAQRDRLLDNALAFEKGEITSKKFSSVVVSVEKATNSLNSRLKDTKARLTELNETGLTHFQQQITAAVDQANNKLETFRQKLLAAQQPQSTDLFKNLFGNLSGQQKTQLSFQLNDIISGLAMGQNPMQILAQQGGQVVQIFQQGKKAQEGVAAATTTAATAQAAFAVSSRASAVTQAQVAVSSQATATAMTEAAGASTILGYSWVGLTASVAAVAVSMLAAYKISQDILKNAQDRLAAEEAITGALNKQYQMQLDFQKRLKDEAEARTFSAFSDSGSIPDLQARIDQLNKERDAYRLPVLRSVQQRGAIASATGLKKEAAEAFTNKEVPANFAENLQKYEDQISSLTAKIAELRQTRKQAFSENVIEGAMRSAASAREAMEQQAVEAAKKRKELIEKAKDDAKKWADHVKGAMEAVKGIVANTSDNPFVKIFIDGENAVQKMLEATRGLGAELQNNLRKLIESDSATKMFKQSMENNLKAANLRTEAAQFLGKGKATVSETLQSQLRAIGAGSPFVSDTFTRAADGTFSNLIKSVDPNQRARDQKIIELTRGISEDQLTPAQKQQAAAARLREAAAIEAEKPDAVKIAKETLDVLKTLKEGKALTVDINDTTGRVGAMTPTPQSVDLRYPNQ